MLSLSAAPFAYRRLPGRFESKWKKTNLLRRLYSLRKIHRFLGCGKLRDLFSVNNPFFVWISRKNQVKKLHAKYTYFYKALRLFKIIGRIRQMLRFDLILSIFMLQVFSLQYDCKQLANERISGEGRFVLYMHTRRQLHTY